MMYLLAMHHHDIRLKRSLIARLYKMMSSRRRELFGLVRATLFWKLRRCSYALTILRDWVIVCRHRRSALTISLKNYTSDKARKLITILLTNGVNSFNRSNHSSIEDDSLIRRIFNIWKQVHQSNTITNKSLYQTRYKRLPTTNANESLTSISNNLNVLLRAKPRTNIPDFLQPKYLSDRYNNHVNGTIGDSIDQLSTDMKKQLAKDIIDFVIEIKSRLQPHANSREVIR